MTHFINGVTTSWTYSKWIRDLSFNISFSPFHSFFQQYLSRGFKRKPAHLTMEERALYIRENCNSSTLSTHSESSQVSTVCPRISDPFYICSNLLYKMGHYFLDRQYIHVDLDKFILYNNVRRDVAPDWLYPIRI